MRIFISREFAFDKWRTLFFYGGNREREKTEKKFFQFYPGSNSNYDGDGISLSMLN
jgi:hypothetical protein